MRFISRQKAEGRRQKGGAALPAACRPLPACSHGFTLVEMLVVIGIIVLAITLAIPAVKSLTGSKSEQSAQNTIAAVLSRVRADAIGLQQITGALFCLDKATDRVTVYEVNDSGFETGDTTGVVYLNLTPDRDALKLPPGLRLRTLKDTPPYGSTGVDPAPTARYLGFNDGSATQFNIPSAPTFDLATLGGVVLFDANGRLVTRQYGFRFVSHPAVGTPTITALQQLVTSTPSISMPNWPGGSGPIQYLRSQIGFVVFDREMFLNQSVSGTAYTDSNNPTTDSSIQGNKDVGVNGWLDVSTTPILVNRYHGTLSRAE